MIREKLTNLQLASGWAVMAGLYESGKLTQDVVVEIKVTNRRELDELRVEIGGEHIPIFMSKCAGSADYVTKEPYYSWEIVYATIPIKFTGFCNQSTMDEMFSGNDTAEELPPQPTPRVKRIYTL